MADLGCGLIHPEDLPRSTLDQFAFYNAEVGKGFACTQQCKLRPAAARLCFRRRVETAMFGSAMVEWARYTLYAAEVGLKEQGHKTAN